MSFIEPSVPANIEDLDPNFQDIVLSDADEAGLRWVDAQRLTLEGQGWRDESAPYTRFPDRAEGIVRDPVWQLSRHSAGLCVRFISNAPTLSARWNLWSLSLQMDHMPATGVSGIDLYAREAGTEGPWRWAAIGKPTGLQNEYVFFENGTEIEREYCAYLPLYNGTTSFQIGVPAGRSLRAAPVRTQKPIVFYGTSILQGGCASRAGIAYPALISRWLDRPHINLGFSGNAKSEPEIAALLAELDAALFVIDPIPNMLAPEIHEFYGPLVKTIRAAHPNAPIVCVETIDYQNAWFRSDRRDRMDGSLEALREVFAGLRADGVPGLALVPGNILLGPDGEGTVDGTHPTDVGFLRMAEAIYPIVKALLS